MLLHKNILRFSFFHMKVFKTILKKIKSLQYFTNILIWHLLRLGTSTRNVDFCSEMNICIVPASNIQQNFQTHNVKNTSAFKICYKVYIMSNVISIYYGKKSLLDIMLSFNVTDHSKKWCWYLSLAAWRHRVISK